MQVKRGVRPIQRAYLRQPEPVHFPIDAEMPEGGVHFELCTAVFDVLRAELEGRCYVGSSQFVYWDATNPKLCLSPDIMVRVGAPDQPLPCLKVWEFGAPDLAVEIISRSDTGSLAWDLKLQRYRAAGVAELVRFDPEDTRTPLRIWDRIDDDLVERDSAHAFARYCDVLELWWLVTPDERLGQRLKLARDSAGREMLLSSRESAEAERAAKEAALARIAELEAQLSMR
jgi:Uma2 family endonuclease